MFIGIIERSALVSGLRFGNAALGFLLASQMGFAGSLTPSGPPGSTMKALSDVEPRTAISSLPTTITQPGSYYLVSNFVGASGQHGIVVSASNVTLDLMGFTLTGIPGTSSGILIASGVQNVGVRNGTLTKWGRAVRADSDTTGVQLTHLNALECDQGLLISARNSVIEGCVASLNSGSGITVSSGCRVANCTASGNQDVGFNIAEGSYLEGTSIVTNCVAKDNRCKGMLVASNALITNCVVTGNGTEADQFDSGIYVWAFRSEIKDCNISNNRGNGVLVHRQCLVKDNLIVNNTSVGIRVGYAAIDNWGGRVEGNMISGNGTGILIPSVEAGRPGNLIIRNTLSGNTLSQSIGAGNSYAQFINVSGSAGFVSSDPMANLIQ